MPFIQTPQLNIHYRQAGAGDQALVLLHGNFASWRWWQPLLQRLPPGCRAYAPDLRGYGDTTHRSGEYTIRTLAQDLQHFTQALNLPQFHLIAHSLGGAAALQYALAHSSRLRTMTLIAPAPAEGLSLMPPENGSPRWLHRLFEIQRDVSLGTIDTLYRLLRSVRANRPLLRAALAQLLPTLPRDRYFRALVKDAGRMAPGAVAGYLRSLDSWNIQGALQYIDTPTLVLWGDGDFAIPIAGLERTVNGMPNARLVKWSGVGHAPHLERPDRFTELLTSFLTEQRDEVPPGGASWIARLRTNLQRWLRRGPH
jgi:branched-chain amino acid transport system permease protein